jgi:hypothetical protein
MRARSQRQADAIRRLESNANIWIATASATGTPHLVPLSLAWDGTTVLVATPAGTPTARNASETGGVKATLDSAHDVVLIDATVEVVEFSSANPSLVDAYVDRVGWNPADEAGEWSLLIITPRTIRAWSGVGEISGRVIMKDGHWLD